MKPVIFFHASCADGQAAAYAAWTVFKDEAEYVAMKYDNVKTINDVDLLGNITERYVYILDFSFPLDVMNHIINVAEHTTWLDHHLTAFRMWCPNVIVGPTTAYNQSGPKFHIELDNARSGGLIACDYFHLPRTMLFKHIDDYDRWQFKLPGTKEFSKALWATAPWSFQQWDELNRGTADGGAAYHAMLATGAALLTEHNNQVARATDKSRVCMVAGAQGLAVNAPPNLTSDSGHLLAKQSGTYGMVYFIDHNLRAKCSLRSTGDYDVSVLAQRYGGGGHKNAAGFECSFDALEQILNSN